MSDPSFVYIDLFLKKGGAVLLDSLEGDGFAVFRELVCKASYDTEGEFYGKNGFNVVGRWNYTNGLQWEETRAYLKWLFDNGYSGVHIVYDESEERNIWVGTVELNLNADGTAYQVLITSKHWDLETRTLDQIEEDYEKDDDFLEHVVVADLPEEGPNFNAGDKEIYWVEMATGDKYMDAELKEKGR